MGTLEICPMWDIYGQPRETFFSWSFNSISVTNVKHQMSHMGHSQWRKWIIDSGWFRLGPTLRMPMGQHCKIGIYYSAFLSSIRRIRQSFDWIMIVTALVHWAILPSDNSNCDQAWSQLELSLGKIAQWTETTTIKLQQWCSVQTGHQGLITSLHAKIYSLQYVCIVTYR